MEYLCKVGMPSGEVIERTFSADDEAALRVDLEQKGYYIFDVRSQGVGEFRLFRPRVKMDTLLMFCQELAALLKAGLPLLQGLEIMLERQKDPTFRRSLTTVRDKIKTGISLSDAFKAEGDLYPGIFASTLLAGERSGNLEGVIRRFVQYLRLTQSMKKKAVSAAVYPAVLLVLMGGLVLLLVTVVIPRFKDFFEGLGGTLPLPTRIVLGISNFVLGNAVLLVLGAAGLVIAGTLWYRREESKLAVDTLLLRLPVIGGLVRMYATSQLARTLSTLLAGGLPLLSALGVAAQSIGNRRVAAAVTSGAAHIREGRSLTVALEATQIVDSLAIEMVKVGEQTGALADMLNTLAEFYDQEMETRLGTVMGLVEPVLLVLMAVVVAGMLIAFYLPMFSIFSQISGGHS
jgi:type IV pilus assembly protein PilC